MNNRRYVVPAAVLCLLGMLCPAASDAQQLATQVRFAGSTAARPVTTAAPVRTRNFVIHADDQVMANKVARLAEQYRKQLSLEWLGRELPDWDQPCPIQVNLAMDAGGETSFAFIVDQQGNGVPVDWDMKIFGPPDRLLDAVLPHEITHTIFATHFGRPLPRWADEGACTTVEHVSERKKNHAMLIRFLSGKPSRGIPFNKMFLLKNYPHDILPLYAQGYSLAKFLIFQRGQREFLEYIATGMKYESQMHPRNAWDRATQEHYQYQDLSDLQVAWEGWVGSGSDENQIARYSKSVGDDRGTMVSMNNNSTANAAGKRNVNPPNIAGQAAPNQQTANGRVRSLAEFKNAPVVAQAPTANGQVGGWYLQQMRRRATDTQTANGTLDDSPAANGIRDSRSHDRLWR